MKLTLFFTAILFTSFTFSQSKKKQLEELHASYDSLVRIVEMERIHNLEIKKTMGSQIDKQNAELKQTNDSILNMARGIFEQEKYIGFLRQTIANKEEEITVLTKKLQSSLNRIPDKYLITDSSAGFFRLNSSWQARNAMDYNYNYIRDNVFCVDACCSGGYYLGNGITKHPEYNWDVLETLDLVVMCKKLSSEDNSSKYKNNKKVFYNVSDNCPGWFYHDSIMTIAIYSEVYKTIHGVGVGVPLREIERVFGKIQFDVGWMEEDGTPIHFTLKQCPNLKFYVDSDQLIDHENYERWSEYSLTGLENDLSVSKHFISDAKISFILIGDKFAN